MLHGDESDEDQYLLDEELPTTDEPGRNQREKDGRDPDEILHLIVTNVADRDSKESYASAHPAEQTTPGARSDSDTMGPSGCSGDLFLMPGAQGRSPVDLLAGLGLKAPPDGVRPTPFSWSYSAEPSSTIRS